MKIIYICLDIDSAFNSQVIELLNHYQKSADGLSITLLLGYKAYKVPVNNAAEFVNTIHFKCYPQFPLLSRLTIKSLSSVLSKMEIDSATVIHTRGELAGYYVYNALGMAGKHCNNILVDVRGASIEELSEFMDAPNCVKKMKYLLVKNATQICHHAAAISVISEALKDYLVSKYRVDSRKISINPCIAGNNFRFDNNERVVIRKQLALDDDDKLIVFSTGGDSKWQNTDYIVKNLADRGYKVLLLTKKTIRYCNTISLFVPYPEMYKYLSAADLGIIWRDDSVVNKVALPIKFSEYVSCGLPILANRGVEAINTYIRQYGYGKLINKFEEINEIDVRDLMQLSRKEISETGRRMFGVEQVGRSYLDVYHSLQNNCC